MRTGVTFVALFGCLLIGNGNAWAQASRVTPSETLDAGSGGTVEPFSSRPRQQTFAGSALTWDRAEQMATASGMTLIDFYPCAFGTDRCAMFQVQGRRGNVFRYQVSSEPCVTLSIDPDSTQVVTQVDKPGITPRRSAARARLAQPTTGQTPATAEQQLPTADEGNAVQCFAGFAVDYRAREAHQLYTGRMGYSIALEDRFQLVDRGRWQDVAVARASAWDLLKEWGQGMSNKGWAFELNDGAGEVLTSDNDSFDWIASGSTGDLPLKDRCEIRANVTTTQANAVIAGLHTACKVTTASIPDSVKVSMGLKPLGVGGDVEAIKNQDFCGNLEHTESEAVNAAHAAIMDDCVNHPGKYFPSLYPPEPDNYTLLVIPGYEPAYGILIATGGAPADCPLTWTTNESVDMGDGVTCSADVTYQCKPNAATGACDCDNPQVGETIVCD